MKMLPTANASEKRFFIEDDEMEFALGQPLRASRESVSKTREFESERIEVSSAGSIDTSGHSSYDAFYAQINGEELGASCSDLERSISSKGTDFETSSTLFSDAELKSLYEESDASEPFGSLDLSEKLESEDENGRSTLRRRGTKKKKKPRGTKTRNNRSNSQRRSRSVELDVLAPFEKTSSKEPKSRESICEDLVEFLSNEMSTDDLVNILPPRTIAKILKKSSDACSHNSSLMEKASGSSDADASHDLLALTRFLAEQFAAREQEAPTSDQEDDLSVISDLTEPTVFFKSKGSQPSKPKTMPLTVKTDEPKPVRCEETNKSHNESKTVKKEAVTFGMVEIRQYERILGINPAVTDGPAISIGWKYRNDGQCSLSDWEQRKASGKRQGRDLLLSRSIRETMLREAGYSQKEIAQATRIVLKAKHQRKTTIDNASQGMEGLEYAAEKVARRIRAVLSLGRI